MKTIILAAGGGTRLFPFTTYKAKPFVNILGKPIIEYILESVYEFSDEFFITIKYFKDDCKKYFGENYKGKKITYIEQGKEKGTAAALYNLDYNYFAGEKIIIMNGDNIINKNDLKNLIGYIKYYGCLAKFSNSPKNHGVLKIGYNHNILGVVEKPSRFMGNLVNGGVYIVNNDIIKIAQNVKLSERGEYEITDAINIFMTKNIFDFYEIKNIYFHITTPFDIYKTGMYFLRKSKKFNYFSEYKHINLTGKNYIGKLCTIGNNVTINNCIINEGVHIGDNSILNNCLIGEKSYIGENFKFDSDKIKIFGPHSYINQK